MRTLVVCTKQKGGSNLFALVRENVRKGYREEVTFNPCPKGFVEFHLVNKREGVASRGQPEQGQGSMPAHGVFVVSRACGPRE